MKWIRLIVSTVFIVGCNAGMNEYRSLRSSFDTNDTSVSGGCWEDGKLCNDVDCKKCCSGNSSLNGTSFCGVSLSIQNGTFCDSEDCWTCSDNIPDKEGKECQQCISRGAKCDVDSTCSFCCDYAYWQNQDTHVCGCMEDETKCIPGETCSLCCNGAYDNNGYTCGGTCKNDGEECTYGDDCYKCCSYATYWYSKEKYHCGMEPCLKDGASCIPNLNCNTCCNGGTFGDDDTKCGGQCWDQDTECDNLSTCSKCCLGEKYWDGVNKTMKCGLPVCLDDGTPCIPGQTCNNCCNGAYDDNGLKCGGTCLPEGTKCNYDTTCNLCCFPVSKFNQATGSHECSNYDE